MLLNSSKIKLINTLVLCSLTFAILVVRINRCYSQDNRINEWREDLKKLKLYLPALDKSFTPSAAYIYSSEPSLYIFSLGTQNTLEDFYKKADELNEKVPDLNDNEMIVELAKLVALSDNAHTRCSV